MLMLGKEYCNDIKRVLRYLDGRKEYVIYYQGKPEIYREANVHVFVDVD
jgi:hypothetical protein